MANVMVVDDETAIVFLIRFILEQGGHQVTEAYNGQEAAEALGIDPPNPSALLPDLLVLDIMMPIMDGHQLSLAMRQNERTKNIPIIVVTAKGDMRELFEAMPSVALFLKKPFEPNDLRDAVAKILSGKT